MNLRRVMLLAAIAVAGVAGPAGEALAWQRVGRATAAPTGDGRSVAWQASPGEVEIVQPGTAPRRIEDPDGCADGLRAVSQRDVLFACGGVTYGNAVYAVVNRVSGDVTRVAFGTEFFGAGGETPEIEAIGDHWLAGPYHGLHVSTDLYASWPDPRPVSASGDRFGPHRYLDLDAARLGRPLCPRVTRRPITTDFDTVPSYTRLVRDGSWFLDGQGFPRLDRTLRLLRCGAKPRLLGAGSEGQPGSGWLSWRPSSKRHGPGARITLLRLHDGHRFSLPLPAHPRGSNLAILHTARAVYVGVPTTNLGPDGLPQAWVIQRARLP